MNEVMEMIEFKFKKVEKKSESEIEWEKRKKCWDMIYDKLNKKKLRNRLGNIKRI
jgi:hypothetical protein